MTLKWNDTKNTATSSLKTIDLSQEQFKNLIGVYIIWSNSTYICVGSGLIKASLKDFQADPKLSQYDPLQVAWAETEPDKMENIENYLIDKLKPSIGSKYPGIESLEVNLPF